MTKARRRTQCDEFEEPPIDPEDCGEPTTPLARQKRARDPFTKGMPRIDFDDKSPILRPTVLYNSMLERGMLAATVKLYWLRPEAKDDVYQETWLYLLESTRLPEKATAKELFGLAYYTALHQYVALHRDDPDAKPLVASQMKLPTIDADVGGHPDDKAAVILPWDLQTNKTVAAVNIDDTVVANINKGVARDAMRVLNKDDRRFMARYLAKKSAHKPAQHKRAERLRKKLQSAGAKTESGFL